MEFPSPVHTARANKGPGMENCGAMLRAPSPAPCPGARISAGRGNDLSSLIHSLLQDQTWPAGRSPGLSGVGGARAGPAGSGCPLGARMLSGTPGRGGMLFGKGCFSGGMLLGEKSCTSPTHPSPGSVPDPGRGPPAVRVLAPGAGGGQSPGPGSPARGGPALPPLPSPPPGPCRSRHSEPSQAKPCCAAGAERAPCARGERRGCGGHRAHGAIGDGEGTGSAGSTEPPWRGGAGNLEPPGRETPGSWRAGGPRCKRVGLQGHRGRLAPGPGSRRAGRQG